MPANNSTGSAWTNGCSKWTGIAASRCPTALVACIVKAGKRCLGQVLLVVFVPELAQHQLAICTCHCYVTSNREVYVCPSLIFLGLKTTRIWEKRLCQSPRIFVQISPRKLMQPVTFVKMQFLLEQVTRKAVLLIPKGYQCACIWSIGVTHIETVRPTTYDQSGSCLLLPVLSSASQHLLQLPV